MDLEIAAARLPLAGARVLIVDDNADAREILAIVLRAEGANVVTASSSAEAINYLDQALPDMMFVDISMPVVNGFELVRMLRLRPVERGGLVPAAALTGYLSADDQATATRVGFQAYLTKPVESKALVDTVKRLGRPVRPS